MWVYCNIHPPQPLAPASKLNENSFHPPFSLLASETDKAVKLCARCVTFGPYEIFLMIKDEFKGIMTVKSQWTARCLLRAAPAGLSLNCQCGGRMKMLTFLQDVVRVILFGAKIHSRVGTLAREIEGRFWERLENRFWLYGCISRNAFA